MSERKPRDDQPLPPPKARRGKSRTVRVVADLVPDQNNANRGTERGMAALEQSLRQYGAGRSILADKEGRVIAGNKTLEKAAELGLAIREVHTEGDELVVVVRDDLDLTTDRAARELAYADNRISELDLAWDADVIQADIDAGVDLAAFFAPGELESIFAAAAAEEEAPPSRPAAGLIDDAPDLPTVPLTRQGDLWQLGRHRLLCGDARDLGSIRRLCGGTPVNLAVTSPPYASQRTYDATSGFAGIAADEYGAWYAPVAANLADVLAPDGSYCLNIKPHVERGARSLYVLELALAHCRAWGWSLVDELCWQRTALPGLFGPRFKNEWEPVYHFARQGVVPKFRPANVVEAADQEGAQTYVPGNNLTMGRDYTGSAGPLINSTVRSKNFDGALPGNVVVANKQGGVKHPAQFPVGLVAFLAQAFTDPGDALLDPFCGSGTTIIAAETTGRVGLGCELSPAYCDVILQRWEALTGEKATLLGNPAEPALVAEGATDE